MSTKNRKRRIYLTVLLPVVLLLVAESIARYAVGLGDTAVFIEAKGYEYILAPDQEAYRFGNRIATNRYSMRSKPLKNSDKKRILKIGDSIIFGGNHVDQDSLSSSILEKELQQTRDASNRVLNISAPSWGPDNALAYLQHYGHFNAGMLVLVFSSHDLYDNRHFRKVVGQHRAWPDRKPLLALTDGWSGYIWPKIRQWSTNYNEYAYLDGFDDSTVNPGWEGLIQYAGNHSLELVVYLHPEKGENQKKAFNSNGKQLQEMLADRGALLVSGLETGLTNEDYHDHIHLLASGHRKMAKALKPYLLAYLDQAE